MNSTKEIKSLYKTLNKKYRGRVPKKKDYNFLKTAYNEIYHLSSYRRVKTLTTKLLKNSTNDELVRLLYAFPVNPLLLDYLKDSASETGNLHILASIIVSYELIVEKTNVKDLKQEYKVYINALKELAFKTKRNFNNEMSYDMYNKLILMDPDNEKKYRSQNLVNMSILLKDDELDQSLDILDDDNLGKVFYKLLHQLISNQIFDREYIKALSRSKTLLDAICENDIDLLNDEEEKEFFTDFIEFFYYDKDIIDKFFEFHNEEQ